MWNKHMEKIKTWNTGKNLKVKEICKNSKVENREHEEKAIFE